ncbi:MAG: hypothetical protein OQL16_06110, partial [Gammaproteobacteria bacterium]|nr:hypothetical protein [Gammaproteobacteria bacterium]
MATLLLSGCQSVQIEQQEEHQARLARVLEGFAALEANEIKEWESPRYDVLRKHMVNNTDNITPEMLGSDKKPTVEEKDAIFEWANFGMEMNKER